MTELLRSSWFGWAMAIAIGLPLGLVLLTELRAAAARRGSGLVRSLDVLRNYVLPLGALLVLLTKANDVSADATPVRIIGTVFGFVVMILVLSGLNVTLFQSAPEGSWRKRIPTIFLDVARLVMIMLGLAMILSWVWGADVGGLFTALGVTSIVLGLALQNSVGQIISGLLLLFEQPFKIGDWVESASARGRVIEVNWRATHIDTGSGMQIIPNSVLAGSSFTNLSRPVGSHSTSVVTVFADRDAPDRVCAMLDEVARALPQLRADAAPSTTLVGESRYSTSIPLRSPADDSAAKSLFQRWVWYAARRADLHLDNTADFFPTPARVAEAVARVAAVLRLADAERGDIAEESRLIRYGADERIQAVGEIPDRMLFIVAGRVQIAAPGADGAFVPVRTLEPGDFVGQTALTREPVRSNDFAVGEVTALAISRSRVEGIVLRNPRLLQELSRSIEERRQSVTRALARG